MAQCLLDDVEIDAMVNRSTGLDKIEYMGSPQRCEDSAEAILLKSNISDQIKDLVLTSDLI